MTQTRAIETFYNGHLFRSRLEARWAAMFDLLRWDWIYEPIDGNGYIPDFVIRGDRPLLVEVKPALTRDDMIEQTAYVDAAVDGHWTGDVLVLGLGPMVCTSWDTNNDTAASIGLLGEVHDITVADRIYSDAVLTSCGLCGSWGVFHEHQSWQTRPCGHGDGDHYLNPADYQPTARMWGQAHERTRWVPSR